MQLFGSEYSSQRWYYATICTPFILFLAFVLALQDIILDSQFAEIPWYVFAVVVVMFLSVLVNCITSFFGMLWYGDPEVQNNKNIDRFERSGWDAQKRLVVCFVSQGLQMEVLKESVRRAHELLVSMHINYEIELVVDSAQIKDPLFAALGCVVVEVPRTFSTKSGARFKARALCYAAHARLTRYQEKKNVWILHLDEDTLLTRQAILGVHSFLSRAGWESRCGAGEKKLYSLESSSKSRFYRWLDFHCTGEDLGRYRLQFKMWKASIFGAHGSFIVMPIAVDTPDLYEVGPEGSLTEDAYVAMRLRLAGIPMEWIDGHVYEQAPHDFKNFLLQRARWIHGLINLFMESKLPAKYRMVWFTYVYMWRTGMLTGLIFLVALLNLADYPWILALGGFAITVMGTVVAVGTLRNTEDDVSLSSAGRLAKLVKAFCFAPIVSLMETGAVLYALVYRPSSFYVVEKRSPLIPSIPQA